MSQHITHLGLRNFKAFHFLEDLELRPLTVLVGANSSGKSSILQSLLLLKQSLLSSPKGFLKFDGDLVKLGSFESVISGFDTTRTLEYRFGGTEQIPVHELRRYFPKKQLPDQIGQPTVALLYEFTLRFSLGESGRLEAGMSSNVAAPPFVQLDDPDDDPIIDHIRANVPDAKLDASIRQVKVLNQGFLPQGFLLSTEEDLKALARAQEPVSLKFLPIEQVPAIATPVLALRDLLERLEHLGPVRADPRPFYPVDKDADLGPRGEGAIPYLLAHQSDPLPFPDEPERKVPLLEVLNHWLGRMGVTQQLTLDQAKDISFTAQVPAVSAPARAVNLTQVGFGVSQLLPVLLLGLKQPLDGFILYEQPESQLHPRLQADLGDFFLAAARSGKTILLETHSDYLVNRLRRRIAEDQTGALANQVHIVFVHPGTQDNPSSYVEPLHVGPDGTIINCPADFFSEAADEAFALMRARAERARHP